MTSRRAAWWILILTLLGVAVVGLFGIVAKQFESRLHLVGTPGTFQEIWPEYTLVGVLWFVAAAVVAFLVGSVAAHRFQARFGGLTGDTFGAIVELSTLAFWLALAGIL